MVCFKIALKILVLLHCVFKIKQLSLTVLVFNWKSFIRTHNLYIGKRRKIQHLSFFSFFDTHNITLRTGLVEMSVKKNEELDCLTCEIQRGSEFTILGKSRW